MPKRLPLLVLSIVLFAPGPFANQRGHSRGSSHTRNSSSHSKKAASISKGRIKRSAAAKTEFERETGYPHGRKGYVVDHIVPLTCGGADAPANMQWQTKEEGKAKDKTERIGCK